MTRAEYAVAWRMVRLCWQAEFDDPFDYNELDGRKTALWESVRFIYGVRLFSHLHDACNHFCRMSYDAKYPTRGWALDRAWHWQGERKEKFDKYTWFLRAHPEHRTSKPVSEWIKVCG